MNRLDGQAMSKRKAIKAAEIAKLVGGEVVGDGGAEVRGVASLEGAGPEDVSFLGSAKHKEAALASKAGALIVGKAIKKDVPQVVVADPYAAFVKVMEYFHPAAHPAPGVHQTAVVDKDVTLGADVSVGPLAVIGAGARIGARSHIGAGAVIGPECAIGEDCVIHARVTLYAGTVAGSRVVVHSGTVIGSDGFGYILSDKGHVKMPQVGRVEIGANCAIDRAMLDATVIGAGTKLDNLVHIAHGVRTGKHCIILAEAALGGSVRLGDFCMISGHATIKDNVTLGDRVTVVGHSGVADDVAAGQTVWGMPAMPFSLAKRVYGRFKQLPELFTRVRALEKKIKPRDE
jgi:UDP-3-O-[3-hydroxymyristoyl] glucosamine N-acyltransferase